MIERAIINMLMFESMSNQVILYLMRQALIEGVFARQQFSSYEDWAQSRFSKYRSTDTIQRLCSVVLKVIAPLDAEPLQISGRSVSGLDVLVESNSTSLQKLSGYVANAEPEQREKLVAGLLSGTSDYNSIKAKVGWEPRIGKWEAVFEQILDEETGEVVWRGIFPAMTPDQFNYCYSVLKHMLNAHMSSYEHPTD